MSLRSPEDYFLVKPKSATANIIAAFNAREREQNAKANALLDSYKDAGACGLVTQGPHVIGLVFPVEVQKLPEGLVRRAATDPAFAFPDRSKAGRAITQLCEAARGADARELTQALGADMVHVGYAGHSMRMRCFSVVMLGPQGDKQVICVPVSHSGKCGWGNIPKDVKQLKASEYWKLVEATPHLDGAVEK